MCIYIPRHFFLVLRRHSIQCGEMGCGLKCGRWAESRKTDTGAENSEIYYYNLIVAKLLYVISCTTWTHISVLQD